MLYTQYFGLSRGSNARKKFFEGFEIEVYENTSSDEEYFNALDSMKLSMFKQKGAAQCTEYASLTQQCLSLVGIESSLVLGKLECSFNSQESKSEYHAYNIINIEGKKYVIDAANPRIAYNSKGDICGMKTTVINIGETYDKLQEGVSKNISNIEESDGEWTNIDARKVSYTTYQSVIEILNDGLNQSEMIN